MAFLCDLHTNRIYQHQVAGAAGDQERFVARRSTSGLSKTPRFQYVREFRNWYLSLSFVAHRRRFGIPKPPSSFRELRKCKPFTARRRYQTPRIAGNLLGVSESRLFPRPRLNIRHIHGSRHIVVVLVYCLRMILRAWDSSNGLRLGDLAVESLTGSDTLPTSRA